MWMCRFLGRSARKEGRTRGGSKAYLEEGKLSTTNVVSSFVACQCGNGLHSDSRAELLLFGTTLFLASGKRPFTSLVFNSLGRIIFGVSD